MYYFQVYIVVEFLGEIITIMADTTICIYSQNISGDMHSEELIKIKGMEEMTFEKRFDKVVRNITPEVDVVAINEVSEVYI